MAQKDSSGWFVLTPAIEAFLEEQLLRDRTLFDPERDHDEFMDACQKLAEENNEVQRKAEGREEEEMPEEFSDAREYMAYEGFLLSGGIELNEEYEKYEVASEDNAKEREEEEMPEEFTDAQDYVSYHEFPSDKAFLSNGRSDLDDDYEDYEVASEDEYLPYEQDGIRLFYELEGETEPEYETEVEYETESEDENDVDYETEDEDEVEYETNVEYESEVEDEGIDVEFLDEDEARSGVKYVWKFREYPPGGGKTKPGETGRPTSVWKITRISQPKQRQLSPEYQEYQETRKSPTPEYSLSYEECQQIEKSPTPEFSRDYEEYQRPEKSPTPGLFPGYEESQQSERSATPESSPDYEEESEASESSLTPEPTMNKGSARPKRRRDREEDSDEEFVGDNYVRPKRAKTGRGLKGYIKKPASQVKDSLPEPTSTAKNEPKFDSNDSAEEKPLLGRVSNAKPKRKNGAWSDAEHDALHQLILEQRTFETQNPDVKKLRDENLFRAMSARLNKMGFDRSPNAAKNYWNRYGRARSRYDERVGVKMNQSLTTSAQVGKGKARKN